MTAENSSFSNQAQRHSKSYELAELDRDFILGDSMRGVRLQLEYAKIEESLHAWGVRSTVVVFGGHRIDADGPHRHRSWYQQARSFAYMVSQQGGDAQHAWNYLKQYVLHHVQPSRSETI